MSNQKPVNSLSTQFSEIVDPSLPPEIIELGDAQDLTFGNAGGPSIDPGTPPTGSRQQIIST